ncbi:MAG: YIP1 family protein [Desulfobacterales bacterium]|nr:YIP1 family protein [Desulfobacterales bacterium]
MATTGIIYHNSDSMFRRYVKQIGHIMLFPGNFYQSVPLKKSISAPLGFLCLTCVIYSIMASFIAPGSIIGLFIIRLANAILIPVITSLILFLSLLVLGKKQTFTTVFSITAYTTATLLFSWIPGIILLTTCWQFVLIYTGLRNALKIKRIFAFISVFTVITTLLGLASLLNPEIL